MKILHTSDWHVGRRLGRHDRTQEFRDVLDEVVGIADAEAVDLVLVSGDVFDRPIPPVDALGLALDALQRLATLAPIVAVAGNHDSPELFEALAPFLRDRGRGVHLVGRIKRPDEGGVLDPDTLGVPAAVACFPFLREGRVVDFMHETGQWYGRYAEKVAAIAGAYNRALVDAGPEVVPLMVAHFMVSGVRVSHSERELHIGDAYTATSQAIPPGPQYVALGHIHAPQRVPGAPVPAEYAGSLLSLDFGEAGEQKRVVMVDVEPGRLAEVTSFPLASGRPLRRETGTREDLESRVDELAGYYLELIVELGGPDAELGRWAADTFPNLVRVRAEYPGARVERTSRSTDVGQDDPALFAAYHEATYGEPPPEALATLFREVMEDADATA